MKTNRIYFYLFIILLFNAFHLISEIYTADLQEGLSETIILLPVTFFYTLFIFWSRVHLKTKLIPKIIDIENRSQFLSVWTAVILIKTISLTFIWQTVAYLFEGDDDIGRSFF